MIKMQSKHANVSSFSYYSRPKISFSEFNKFLRSQKQTSDLEMQYVKEAPERFIIQGLDSFSNPARAVILERGNLSLELLDIMAKDTHPAIKELALEKRQEAIKKQASGADLNKATRK